MTGLENIKAFDGVSTAISGMLIVFVSLILISLYIAVLPRLLEVFHVLLPESDHPDVLAAIPPPKKKVTSTQPLEQVVAAAVAIHASKGGN